MDDLTGFLHLNDAGQWSGFETFNIDNVDGTLRLKQIGPGAFETQGVFRGGPFGVVARAVEWFRLAIFADALPDDAHLQLYTFTASAGTADYDKTSETPFSGPGWVKTPRDSLDLVIRSRPAAKLWIGGVLRGHGKSTPVLRQMRLEYGRDTYLAHLPPIYGAEDNPRDFLERYLAMHQSVLGGIEDAITGLPRLFNPESAPSEGFPSWLRWLASWLAFAWSDRWKLDEGRRNLAGAFELYGMRGTVESLRRYIKLYTGADAHIEEPIQSAALWSLGESSSLGFSTQLAPAHWQGAVLDSTANLDRSVMTRGDEPGAALWDDIAHRFCVWVFCGDLNFPGSLDAVRQVIDREKPAHTDYHLCAVEPRFRVGLQARVGVDTVIGAPAKAVLGDQLGAIVLAKESEPCRPLTPGGGTQ